MLLPRLTQLLILAWRRLSEKMQSLYAGMYSSAHSSTMQSGISNPEVEQQLAAAGIDVVVSRCLMVDRRAAEQARGRL